MSTLKESVLEEDPEFVLVEIVTNEEAEENIPATQERKAARYEFSKDEKSIHPNSDDTKTFKLSGTAHSDGVSVAAIELTLKNWALSMEEHEMAFVYFAAPWNVLSQQFLPAWEDVAQEVATAPLPILVGKVDCVTQEDLCREQGITTAAPTLRWYRNGVFTPNHGDEPNIKVRTIHVPLGVGVDCMAKAFLCREQIIFTFPTMRWFHFGEAIQSDDAIARDSYASRSQAVAALTAYARNKLELDDTLKDCDKERYAVDEATSNGSTWDALAPETMETDDIVSLYDLPVEDELPLPVVSRVNAISQEATASVETIGGVYKNEEIDKSFEELRADGLPAVDLNEENWEQFMKEHEMAFVNLNWPRNRYNNQLLSTWEEFAQDV